MSVETAIFNDGNKMPFFGFGTYSLKDKEGEEAIEYAIEIGYRHIDTAYFYKNEKEVGNAIRKKIEDGTVKREDLFVVTKLSAFSHKENEVVPACKEALKNLNLDYLDLFLIHNPISLKKTEDTYEISNIDFIETWKGMENCKKQGLARSIGVSNFNSEQITRLLSNCEIKPVNNQVEVTLNLPQKELIEFCKKHDITVTGYSPLGKPGSRPHIKNLWLDPKVQELSKKYGKTPAQISLRFVYQNGAAPIPKSKTKSRIKENFEIFDFSLTSEEMNDLLTIGTGARIVPLDKYKESKYYPFNIPF